MADESLTEATGAEAGDVSEAQIAVHWREEGYYFPSAKFIGQANAFDPGIFERFAEDRFPECFKEYGDLLSWDAYWHTTLDTTDPPFWKWFVGGRLNASYNCIDRHLTGSRNKAAIFGYQNLRPRTPRRSPTRNFTGGSTSSRLCFEGSAS